MMRKSIGHRDKFSNKREISQSHSNDGTAARTRPFSFDEIMLWRKKKKQSGSVEDQQGGFEAVSGKGAEGISDCMESDTHRHRNIGCGPEEHTSKDSSKVSSRMKEDKFKTREEKIVEGEYKENNNAQRRSKVGSANEKDRRKERDVNEKRKNHDRPSVDPDNEHRKRHGKVSAVEDGDINVERNRVKSENVSKKRTQNGNGERGRAQDAGKKHESRKWHDYDTSERKQVKGTSEYRHEDSKLRIKRSRSREHDRDKRRSNSPSLRGHKQRLYDVQEHEELSTHSSKDRPGRFDSNVDRKRVSNSGSSNKSKRHDASASRLGGYSPRKRRGEAAVKNPSPTSHSPEKNAGWDSSTVKMEGKFPTSFQSDLLPLNKTELSIKHEVPNVAPLFSSIPKPSFGVLSSIPLMMNASVDSVQLTQATRPQRRIYVENLPSSASEAAIMEWLSCYLRPSGINHLQSTSPCISCIVNKDKYQALVEFLTPEDASTALSLDGKSFSGSILKIRRPKDYVEVTTGVSEKPVAGAVSVKNIVEDSPNKIFIGGISKVITSEMLMEIACAFGPLKAYHFEDNVDLDGPCAFIEYADQSVTVKACVGLNGMKLGGKVQTVTQATPNASSLDNIGGQPFYGTPVHARPLLEKPTQVLKLNNLLDPHSFSSLSEPELEEILEDVRLECARFGMVKSVNIVKQANRPRSSETVRVTEKVGSIVDEVTDDQCKERGSESSEQHEEVKKAADGNNCRDDEQDPSASKNGTNEPEKVCEAGGADDIVSDEHDNRIVKDETCDTTMNSNQISPAIDQSELNYRKPTDAIEMENKSLNPETVSPESHDATKDEASDSNDTFEAGCALVEFKRLEASSMAAHCLHGRIFDGRIVSVEYVAYDVYRARFHK